MENKRTITVKDAIKTLLEYPMNKELFVYDRETKSTKPLLYIGASINDNSAWNNEIEMPYMVNWVEILV